MGEIYRIKVYLVICPIIVTLLSLTRYYENWKEERNAINSRFIATPFYAAHVLDPAIDGHRFTSWTRQEWLAWLDRRDILYQNVHPSRKSSLKQKGLNSVLIASLSQVISAFEGQRYPYNPANYGRANEQNNLFWSEGLFPSFVFERVGSTYRVFQCPPMYIAVGIRNSWPVHLHEHSKRREMRSYRVKVKVDCTEIK